MKRVIIFCFIFINNAFSNDLFKEKRVLSINKENIEILNKCFLSEIPKNFNRFSFFKKENIYLYEIEGVHKHHILINSMQDQNIINLSSIDSSEYRTILEKVISICDK